MTEVLALSEELAQIARDADGVLVWELSIQGDAAYGYERFDNATAVFAHVEAITPLFPRMKELWTSDVITPTPPLPTEVRAVLDQFGALTPDATFGNH